MSFYKEPAFVVSKFISGTYLLKRTNYSMLNVFKCNRLKKFQCTTAFLSNVLVKLSVLLLFPKMNNQSTVEIVLCFSYRKHSVFIYRYSSLFKRHGDYKAELNRMSQCVTLSTISKKFRQKYNSLIFDLFSLLHASSNHLRTLLNSLHQLKIMMSFILAKLIKYICIGYTWFQ